MKNNNIRRHNGLSRHFTLSKNIPINEKIEIIKMGFYHNRKNQIPLKEFYEGIGSYSLFEWKGIRIRFIAIRYTDLYLRLKKEQDEENEII